MKKIALQLYSLREFLTADPIGTLKKVHDMGYDGVEWPGVGEKAPEDLEKITSNAGLEFFSVHITADDILTVTWRYCGSTQRLDVNFYPLAGYQKNGEREVLCFFKPVMPFNGMPLRLRQRVYM